MLMMLTLLEAAWNKHTSDFAYGHAYIRACMRANDIVCVEYRYVHIAARSILLRAGKRMNDASVRWKRTGAVRSRSEWSWKISCFTFLKSQGRGAPVVLPIGVSQFDSSIEEIKATYRNKLTLAVSKFSMRKMETLPRNGGISRFRYIVRVTPDKKFARAFWKIHQFFKVLSDVCTSEAEMYITIIFQTF